MDTRHFNSSISHDAIARHLVELHNGTIHATSLRKGQGVTFSVMLPILQERSSLRCKLKVEDKSQIL
ncbi:hypothetical protein CSQ79_12580 [Gloeocapsopsis sp. IPPAS B-1203]|nr:hypothetical protein CSQ79_12580 [Gloeocapsopsis sp. IPPAS B-1203]